MLAMAGALDLQATSVDRSVLDALDYVREFSVDGLRFVVPKRTINAGPSPKYYHFKRGITWLNAVNDQVAGIGQMVVPGTPCDSLHILDTLLNLDAGARPEMVATDNASYLDPGKGQGC